MILNIICSTNFKFSDDDHYFCPQEGSMADTSNDQNNNPGKSYSDCNNLNQSIYKDLYLSIYY
jgi:hypothetical protein